MVTHYQLPVGGGRLTGFSLMALLPRGLVAAISSAEALKWRSALCMLGRQMDMRVSKVGIPGTPVHGHSSGYRAKNDGGQSAPARTGKW